MIYHVLIILTDLQENEIQPKFLATADWNRKFEEAEKARKFAEWKAKYCFVS